MKYAIRCKSYGTFLRRDAFGKYLFSGGAERAAKFGSQEEALDALQRRAADPEFPVRQTATLVGINEIPGETRKEVVELTGVVDLTGLEFGVEYHGGPMRWSPLLKTLVLSGAVDRAVYTDIGDAYLALAQARTYWFSHAPWVRSSMRVVGIREVTTPATLEVVELAPATESDF